MIGATNVDDAARARSAATSPPTTTENLVHGSRRPRVGRARDRALLPEL